MVPEGWQSTTLGEHIDLLSGFPFSSSSYTDDPDDIRLVRGDNVVQGNLRWRDAKRWPKEEFEEFSKYHLSVGDIVIAMDRTWVSDGLKISPITEADCPSLLLQRVARLRALNTLAPELLGSLVRGHRFEQYVKSVQTATAVPHISAQQIKDFPILLPPLAEQKRIAEVLGIWDRAIEVAGKQLDLARTQKRALMQTLLTPTRRFPGYEGQPWKEVRLGDVGQIVSGGTPDSTDPSCWDGNIPWATPTDITKLQTRYISTTARNLTEKGVKTSSAHILPAGAILVCTRATIGALAIARNPIATNQGFKSVILRDSHDVEFFYYLLSHNENVMRRLANGSTFLEISKADFESMTFLVPTAEEQKVIATVLNDADAEITTLETQITRLQSEKKALMQQLLTGQKRLAV